MMKYKNFFLIAVIYVLVMPLFCSGHSIIQESQLSSINRAQAVFLVRVTRKDEILSGTNDCGSKYRATIEKAIKGVQKSGDIEFGYVKGLEVGSRYRIYLNSTKNQAAFESFVISSAPYADEALVRTFMATCINIIPNNFLFRFDKLKKSETTAR